MPVDPLWYRKIWTLDIREPSWVESTAREVAFAISVLGLRGGEHILDLACGFGRHALELSARGFSVVGVDITEDYIVEARRCADDRGLTAEFIHADIRDISFHKEFDVVLNLADGAIGYLEDEDENLKVFDRIASALKSGGSHLMGVCNGAYARKHFPRRHWDIGSRSLSLADFAWDEQNSRMLYASHTLKFGELLKKPTQDKPPAYIRLYTLDELRGILRDRGLAIKQAYGDYDEDVSASEDTFTLVVHSEKSQAVTADS
jgi:2-polyprenyl-3-methyl-5-hydroxy-6-metoxy-1,4-benzoquinol methylase